MTHVTRSAGLGAALTLTVAAVAVFSPAAGTTSSYGHTAAHGGTLRSGCHDYRYSYVVDTPTDDWTLETFLRDRRGEPVASGVLLSDSEPARGRATFRFCRYATRAGVFTIRAKVTWYDDVNEPHHARFEPSHFRLRRA